MTLGIQNQTLESMTRRRSIRKYDPNYQLQADELDSILKAAMAAPSANNARPWHFIVVDDRKLLLEISKVHPYGKAASSASAAIVVCGDSQKSPAYWVQDCSAATENILTAATSLDLGSLWLGVNPRLERGDALKKIFDIPEPISILSIVLLGKGEEDKEGRTQYDETKISNNHW